jgi:hypothetical protein
MSEDVAKLNKLNEDLHAKCVEEETDKRNGGDS